MPPRILRALPALLTVAALLGLAASSSAAGWTSAAPIAQPATAAGAYNSVVAVDPNGDAVVAWLQGDGATVNDVGVSTRRAGGAWTSPKALTSNGQVRSVAASIDPRGVAVVVWDEDDGAGTTTIRAATGPAGGAFGTPATLDSGTLLSGFGPTLTGPRVASDPRGGFAAAWLDTDNQGNIAYEFHVASIGTTGGWSGVTPLDNTPADTYNGPPGIAIAPDGRISVVWGGGFAPIGEVFTPGTGWSGAQPLEPGTSATASSGFQVVFDSVGNGTVIYRYGAALRSVRLAASSSTYAASTPVNGSGSSPSLAVGPSRVVTAVWQETAPATGTVFTDSATEDTGGTWSSAVPVFAAASGQNGAIPAVATNGLGTTAALWPLATSSGNRVQSSLSTAAGTWQARQDRVTGGSVATSAGSAADGAGGILAAWSRAGAVEYAVFDETPPAITAIDVPAAGDTLTDVAMTAAASDTWTGANLTWDFGDGAGGAGGSVTHRYAGAGSYLVTLSATDGAGNTVTQTRTIDVAAPAGNQFPLAPPPPGLPRPVQSKTLDAEPISGTVLVREPGTSTFVPLLRPAQLRNGSIIDARRGRVRITIDNGRGGLDTAEFYQGVFKFLQPKVKPGRTAFANLYLVFGSFKGCPKAPKNPKIAALAKSKKSHRSVRHLWGNGKGAFRTVGRFSSATIRGTTWLTDDRCDGTLTKVTAGKVAVRDFVKRKTVIVRKGKRYFAAARPAR